jgi:hypothetical protein
MRPWMSFGPSTYVSTSPLRAPHRHRHVHSVRTPLPQPSHRHAQSTRGSANAAPRHSSPRPPRASGRRARRISVDINQEEARGKSPGFQPTAPRLRTDGLRDGRRCSQRAVLRQRRNDGGRRCATAGRRYGRPRRSACPSRYRPAATPAATPPVVRAQRGAIDCVGGGASLTGCTTAPRRAGETWQRCAGHRQVCERPTGDWSSLHGESGLKAYSYAVGVSI